MRRPRVVFDAGVLVSALLGPDGPAGGLLRLFVQQRAFDLVLTDAILEEFREALHDVEVRRHLEVAPEWVERWTTALALLAVRLPDDDGGVTDLQVIADPEDDKYLTAALESGADLIISSDPHLLELEERGALEVVSPRVFLEVLELRAGQVV